MGETVFMVHPDFIYLTDVLVKCGGFIMSIKSLSVIMITYFFNKFVRKISKEL